MAEKKQEEQQESPPKSNKLKIIIGAVVALLLIAGIGAGAYIMGTKSAIATISADDQNEEKEKTSKKQEEDIEIVSDSEIGPMVKIDNFIVNILTSGDPRFLKAAITLEVNSEESQEEVEARMPQIRDATLLLISNKTFDELRDLQGKMQLRAELAGKINSLLHKGTLKHIYFTNFVIQ